MTGFQIRRRSVDPARRPLMSLDDVAKLIALPWVFAVAWLISPRYWGGIAALQVAVRNRLGLPKLRHLTAQIELSRPRAFGVPAANAIACELETERFVHYLEVARMYRPDGWRPRVELVGLAHLVKALNKGNGAILFVGHFVHNGLAPKLGPYSANYPVAHLSRPEHGYSKTKFGIHFLNPIRRRVEDRFLSRRVVIRNKSGVAATRALYALLNKNNVVSITVGAWEGSQIVELPIIDRKYPIATGAFGLAWATGAKLLPLFCARNAVTGTTTVIIEPALDVKTGADKTTAILAAALEYGERLKPHLLSFPGQWRGWIYLRGS